MMRRSMWRHAPVTLPLIVAGGMVLLRWRLFFQPGLSLGWNSDTAIYGLIAKRMVEDRQPIFLFWGEDYLGTLTSMWTIVVAPALGGIGPLALRVGAMLQVFVAILLFGRLIHRAWGAMPAIISMVWLAAGPRWFFEMSYAPLSAEQMFLVGALILWYADRKPFVAARQWFVLGILVGLGWWAHRGSLFAAVPAVAVLIADDARWRTWSGAAMASGIGAAGVAVGIVPLILGRYEVDQPLYHPITASWSIVRLPGRVAEILYADVWAFLGADPGFAGIIFALVVAIFAVVGFVHSRTNRTATMLIGVLAVSALFWMLSPQAYSGATRYLMLALPVVYGAAARGLAGLLRKPRVAVAGFVAGAAITSQLYAARLADVRDIAAGRREDHYAWRSFDPGPALAELRQEGYAICYADFWVAYKLEWLSGSQVKFIPYRSVDRTQRRSTLLALQPGRKCFVSGEGIVRGLSIAEEAEYRARVLRRHAQ